MNELKQLRDWLDNELFIGSMIHCTDSEFELFKADYYRYMNHGGTPSTSKWKAKTELIYRRFD